MWRPATRFRSPPGGPADRDCRSRYRWNSPFRVESPLWRTRSVRSFESRARGRLPRSATILLAENTGSYIKQFVNCKRGSAARQDKKVREPYELGVNKGPMASVRGACDYHHLLWGLKGVQLPASSHYRAIALPDRGGVPACFDRFSIWRTLSRVTSSVGKIRRLKAMWG